MNTTITIKSQHLSALQAVAKLAAKDIRYALRYVLIDTDQGRAVACNGHTIFTAPIELEGPPWNSEDRDESLLIDLTGIRIPKTPGAIATFQIDMMEPQDKIILNLDKGKVALCERAKGLKYPDWMTVTKTAREGHEVSVDTFAVNPDYVSVVGKALGKIDKTHDRYPVFKFMSDTVKGDLKQIKVQWQKPDDPEKDILHAIMPINVQWQKPDDPEKDILRAILPMYMRKKR